MGDFRIITAFFVFWTTFSAGAVAVTVTVTDSVTVEDVIPIGINLSGDTYYQSPCRKVHNNHSFEGCMYRQCIEGYNTPDGFVASGLPFNEKFSRGWGAILPGGTWWVISGPNKWETGTIVRVDSVSANGEIRPRIVFDKELNSDTKSAILVERVLPEKGAIPVNHGNKFMYDSLRCRAVCGDASPESFGTCALSMDGTDGQCHYRVQGHSNNRTYPIAGDWVVRFRAKKTTPSATLTLKAGRSEKTIPLTDTWKDYSIDFAVDESVAKLWFSFLVNNGIILVDDIETEKTESNSDNKTVFLDQTVEMLNYLNPGVLRYLRMGGQNLENTIRPPLQSMSYLYDPWAKVERQTGHLEDDFSLHEFFELCAHIGAEPWYSLPGTITREEVVQFMEYLAAPPTVGLGALRAELGRVEPWTESFQEIHVEFGNEVKTFAGANFAGKDYWHDLIEAGKSSSYYRSNIKFRISQVGAWSVVNLHPNVDYCSMSSYRTFNLWADNLSSIHADRQEFFRWVFADPFYSVSQKGSLRKQHEQLKVLDVPLTVYEGNYHTTYGDADVEQFNDMVASIGGAIGYANGMMLWLRDLGIKRQCFFNLAQAAAAGFTEHSGIGLWGAVLSARPDSIRIRPSGLTLRAINEMIQSQMIHVTTSGDAPVFEATGPFEEGIKKRKDPETITDIPIINAYAFRGETRKSILLFNLDVVESRQVETLFEGSVIGDSARFMQTIAAGIDANNEYRYQEDKELGPQVTLSDTIIADFQSGRSFTLPPYSLTALSWKYQNGSHSKSKSFLPPRGLRVKMNGGILHVMRGATDTDLDIKLYALNGRQVLRTVFPAGAGRSRSLDLRSENTEKGMYLLRVTQSSTNTVLFQTKISVIDR